MIGPTARQALVLNFVKGYLATRGFPPTIREIAEAIGIRSTNGVVDHLKALERKGFIERQDLASRGIRVLDLEGPPAPVARPAPPPPPPRPRFVAVDRVALGTPLGRLEELHEWLPPHLAEKYDSALTELRTAIEHGPAVDEVA